MFEELFRSYRVGSELAANQPILAVGGVSLLSCSPNAMSESSLAQLSNQPPSNDERLIATPNYLVYKTDYQVLDAMKRAFSYGADRYANDLSKKVINYFLNELDTLDQTVWMPWSQIYAANALVYSQTFNGMFGSRTIPFYYYEISHAAGDMTFLQTPVNHAHSQQAAEQFSGVFNSL